MIARCKLSWGQSEAEPVFLGLPARSHQVAHARPGPRMATHTLVLRDGEGARALHADYPLEKGVCVYEG